MRNSLRGLTEGFAAGSPSTQTDFTYGCIAGYSAACAGNPPIPYSADPSTQLAAPFTRGFTEGCNAAATGECHSTNLK